MLTPILCVVIIVPWLATVITRWIVNRPEKIRCQLPTAADAFGTEDMDFLRGQIADAGVSLLLKTVQASTAGGFSEKQRVSLEHRAAALGLEQHTAGTFLARHGDSIHDLTIEFGRLEPGLLEFAVLTVPGLAERITGMLQAAFGDAGLLLKCDASPPDV